MFRKEENSNAPTADMIMGPSLDPYSRNLTGSSWSSIVPLVSRNLSYEETALPANINHFQLNYVALVWASGLRINLWLQRIAECSLSPYLAQFST